MGASKRVAAALGCLDAAARAKLAGELKALDVREAGTLDRVVFVATVKRSLASVPEHEIVTWARVHGLRGQVSYAALV